MTTNKTKSGQVPTGCIRLNANIQEDLHLRLKIYCAKEKKTIGSIIEEWIEKHTPKL